MEPYATALADGIEKALPGWVERCVAEIMTAWAGGVPADLAAEAAAAGERASRDVGGQIRTLLSRDIDEHRTTPLSILRRVAVRYPTQVLVHAGVPPVERDSFAERAFPEDAYDLGPVSFSDLDPALLDVGMAWGAAKAFEHHRRHGGTS